MSYHSPVIPKEQLPAYERWRLDSFDSGGLSSRTSDPGSSEKNNRHAGSPRSPADDKHPPAQHQATILPTVEEIEHVYQQALEEGRIAGYQQGKQQIDSELEHIRSLVSSLEQALQKIDQEIADDLLALSLDIAQKMVGQALRVHPELLLPVVQDAIRSFPHSAQHPYLILHPDDVSLVRSHLGDQLSHSGWKIREDAALQRGGCRVETSGGKLDASLSARWKRISATISQDTHWLE